MHQTQRRLSGAVEAVDWSSDCGPPLAQLSSQGGDAVKWIGERYPLRRQTINAGR
jgi:hypothetical protein